jgi:hypothetical protein
VKGDSMNKDDKSLLTPVSSEVREFGDWWKDWRSDVESSFTQTPFTPQQLRAVCIGMEEVWSLAEQRIQALVSKQQGEICAKVQAWANNCFIYEAQHVKEGDLKASEYHRGAKEAFERVVDTIRALAGDSVKESGK